MKYIVNGKEVSQEEFTERGPKNSDWLKPGWLSVPNTYRDHDPLMSDGLGCMKSQVGEMRDVIRKHNIQGVTVEDSGRLQITSRQGRRDLLKVRGFCDNDGGYSD